MDGFSSRPVSQLLARWQAGDEQALERPLPVVYQELRRIAHRCLRRERPDHTLQSAVLVHVAYLRLMREEPRQFENRARFFAVSAHLMRQILVEYARRRRAAKRDHLGTIALREATAPLKERNTDVIALDDALKGLAKLDPYQSRIVELRFFGGLSIEETATVLGVSPATVKRHWSTARVWLYQEMHGEVHS